MASNRLIAVLGPHKGNIADHLPDKDAEQIEGIDALSLPKRS